MFRESLEIGEGRGDEMERLGGRGGRDLAGIGKAREKSGADENQGSRSWKRLLRCPLSFGEIRTVHWDEIRVKEWTQDTSKATTARSGFLSGGWGIAFSRRFVLPAFSYIHA